MSIPQFTRIVFDFADTSYCPSNGCNHFIETAVIIDRQKKPFSGDTLLSEFLMQDRFRLDAINEPANLVKSCANLLQIADANLRIYRSSDLCKSGCWIKQKIDVALHHLQL